MYRSLPLALAFLVVSCSPSQWWASRQENDRKIASLSVQQLLLEDKTNFSDTIDEKLRSLHNYYVIGQKNLAAFDAQLEKQDLTKLYESQEYLNLMAVRTQAEEIEHELIDVWHTVSDAKKGKPELKLALQLKVASFAQKSSLSSLSMENLSTKLGMQLPVIKQDKVNMKMINQEYKQLEETSDFIIHEKNIEHIAHMLEIKIQSENKRFYPSTTKSGNITGNEFPPKVWSLTFDDGPGRVTSSIILKNLVARNLPATFFQLTQQVNALPAIAKDIRDAGMEIASHSYTHQQLTKLGPQGLEREITEAVRDLKKASNREIKFFRLPYGAGVSAANIREKIAANNMIHVFWNVDTLDWMAQEPSKIVERTLALMKKTPNDAGVLLFHDIHQRTADATVHIMDYLKKDGRRVCTLDEIVTQMNEGVETVCPKK